MSQEALAPLQEEGKEGHLAVIDDEMDDGDGDREHLAVPEAGAGPGAEAEAEPSSVELSLRDIMNHDRKEAGDQVGDEQVVQEEVEELTYSMAASNPFGNADDDDDDLFGGGGTVPAPHQPQQAPATTSGAFGITGKLASAVDDPAGASFFDSYGASPPNPPAQEAPREAEPARQPEASSNEVLARHSSDYLHAEDEVAAFNPQVQQTYQEVQTPPSYASSDAFGQQGQQDSGADFFDNYDSSAQQEQQHQAYSGDTGSQYSHSHQPSYGGSESYQYSHSQQPSLGGSDGSAVNYDYTTTSSYAYSEQQQQQQQQANPYQIDAYQQESHHQQNQPEQKVFQPQEAYQQAPQESYAPPPQGAFSGSNGNGSYSAHEDYGGYGYSGADYCHQHQPSAYQQQQQQQQQQQPTMMVPVPLSGASSAAASQAAPALMTPQFEPTPAPAPPAQPAASGAWDSYSSGYNNPYAIAEPAAAEAPQPPAQMFQPSQGAGGVSHQDYGYAAYQQQQPQPQLQAGGSSTYGRPACSLVAFGFGGKLCHYSTQLQQVKVTGMAEFVTGEAAGVGTTSGFFREKALMDAFSGPLSALRQGQVKSTLQKVFKEHHEVSSNPAELACARILGILVQNCDKLSKLPSQELSKLIASALLPAEGQAEQAGNGYYSGGGATDTPLRTSFQQVDPSEAASQMQTLLCEGRSQEALQAALQGQLWGPALVLAQSMGQDKFCEAASAMAATCLVKNSPLERLVTSAAESSAMMRNASSSSLNSLNGGDQGHQRTSSGIFGGEGVSGFLNSAKRDGGGAAMASAEASPSPYSAYADQGSSLTSPVWERALCILANNRREWKNLGIKKLGDDLFAVGNTWAAHLCYVLALYELEPWTDQSRMCIVGATLRSLGSPPTKSLHLTEVYEWLIAQHSKDHVSFAFQPYKLLYAFRLVDFGSLGCAAKYCQAVLGKLGPGKLSPELTLCKYRAEMLLERLQNSGGNLGGAGNIGNKILGWLDRGITSLVMGDGPGSSGPGSPHPYQTPQVNQQPHQLQQQQQQPQAAQQQPQAAQQQQQQQPEAKGSETKQENGGSGARSMARANSGGNLLRGAFSSFGNLIRSSVSDPSKEAKLGQEENTFFFDKELGIWREKGKDPPKAGGALPPPPTAASLAAPEAAGEPSAMGGAPPPAPEPSQPRTRGSLRSVRSRYVDTFNAGGGGGGGAKASAGAPKPLVPPAAAMFTPPSASASPGMFVPPAESGGNGSSGPSPAVFMPPADASADAGFGLQPQPLEPLPMMPEPAPVAFGAAANAAAADPPQETKAEASEDVGQAAAGGDDGWSFPSTEDKNEYEDINF